MEAGNNEIIKVFAGSDRSQLIAFKALEHSIKRNTKRQVECRQIDNTMMPKCRSIINAPYTNFSFARFGIPSFTGYKGKGIYVDADMLVMTDIAELWEIPFDGAKVLLLEQPESELHKKQSKKRKQTAVMVLNCEKLTDWKPEKIIGDLGIKYDRTALMSLHILPENEINESIPTTWNCMDWYEEGVSNLVHYTHIETQPWVYPLHKHRQVWMDELKMMLEDGTVDEAFLRREIKLGYVRPSLLVELGFENMPAGKNSLSGEELLKIDAESGFIMHAEMVERHEKRMKHIKRAGEKTKHGKWRLNIVAFARKQLKRKAA